MCVCVRVHLDSENVYVARYGCVHVREEGRGGGLPLNEEGNPLSSTWNVFCLPTRACGMSQLQPSSHTYSSWRFINFVILYFHQRKEESKPMGDTVTVLLCN